MLAHARPLHGAAAGSEVSLRDLLQNRVVEVGVREQPLEAAVLPFKVFQPLGLLDPQAVVLPSPAIVRLLGDLQLLADVLDVSTLAEEYLGFTQLENDLFGGVMLAARSGLLGPRS